MTTPRPLAFLLTALLVSACSGKTTDDSGPAAGTPAGNATGTGTGSGSGTGTGSGTGGPTGDTFQLGFRGQFSQNAGQTMRFGVVDDSMDLVWSTSLTVPGDGNINEVFEPDRGQGAHVLFWWSDVDGNGTCEGPAADLDNGWSEQIGNPPAAQETIERSADTNFAASVCGLSW